MKDYLYKDMNLVGAAELQFVFGGHCECTCYELYSNKNSDDFHSYIDQNCVSTSVHSLGDARVHDVTSRFVKVLKKAGYVDTPSECLRRCLVKHQMYESCERGHSKLSGIEI